jgi:hypothetical protein
MHSSASPWLRLAWVAVLGALPAGCATTSSHPTTCVARYEVTNSTYVTARHQAGVAGDLLADRLGRKAVVKDSTFGHFRVLLDDERVADPSAQVNVVVSHGEGTAWSVSVVRSTPAEDERVQGVRAQIELALRAMGLRWTIDTSGQNLH